MVFAVITFWLSWRYWHYQVVDQWHFERITKTIKVAWENFPDFISNLPD